MARKKHIPQRMCIVCRVRFDKKDLTRVVKQKEKDAQNASDKQKEKDVQKASDKQKDTQKVAHKIIVDESQKADGRGAYICKKAECYEILVKQKRLNRSFSADVPSDVYTELGKQLGSK
ncbi:MAG: YlxR family protein [Firmicutes bacterium]|nr:YlxR family protein [Bacillota bacterium]